MSKRCILSVGFGNDWYKEGLKRLEKDITECRPSVCGLLWYDDQPKDCPPFGDAPYAFKTRAMVEAYMEYGYTKLIWMDSMCKIVAPLTPLWSEIDRRHVVAFTHPRIGSAGEWCIDRALEPLGVTREEIMKMRGIEASVLGIDLDHKKGQDYVSMMLEIERSGALWGPWKRTGTKTYDDVQISKDPRVHGHRHDQPAIAVVLNRLKIEPITMPHLFAHQSVTPGKTTAVVSEGI